MNATITVREYARLTTSLVDSPNLDRAQISVAAFDWLCELSATLNKAGAVLVQIQDRRWLRLDNYVGVLESPCGTRIEILPKHFEQGDCIEESRALLRRMIQASLKLPTRNVDAASLQRFDVPLTEWVMARFLDSLDHLIKRGIRFDYQRVEEEQPFLRGQLNAVRQMRQPPSRRHHFQISHDVFLPDRPENRLLRTALDFVCKATRDSANWRLAHELRSMLRDVPYCVDAHNDLKQWRYDRLMVHYQPVKPWVELIIQQQTPLAVAGDWRGMSLLFPMERLFESYVTACLSATLLPGATLKAQAKFEHLCVHKGKQLFQLRPDLLIEHGGKRWVMDTKWKRLDSEMGGKSYGLSQADLYQMFAYGQKYLASEGDVVLIYPRRSRFQEALPEFEYAPRLKLWVVPFDLELGRLICGDFDLPLR